jgi:hypothetical protein
MTAEAVDRPFVHVTSDSQYQVGMGGDSRGDGSATCKIAGIAYTGSNPVPATTALASNNAVVGRPIKSDLRVILPLRFPSARRVADTARPSHTVGPKTPSISPATLGAVWGELVDVDPLGEGASVGVA